MCSEIQEDNSTGHGQSPCHYGTSHSFGQCRAAFFQGETVQGKQTATIMECRKSKEFDQIRHMGNRTVGRKDNE